MKLLFTPILLLALAAMSPGAQPQFLTQTYEQKESSKKAPADKEVADEDEGVDSPDRWPTQVPVPKNMRLKELSSKKSGMGGNTYESNNYRFNSNAALDDDAQKSVGRLFECAFAANRAVAKVLPIPRAKGNRPSKNKFQARLFKSMDDYHSNGGPQGSAGVFSYSFDPSAKKMTEKDLKGDEVKVPFQSMGLNADGTVKSENVDSHTLVHELTHQCTALNKLPVWANEGIAEYVGYVPYDGEVLDFDKCFITIRDNAKMRGPRLNFPFSLEDFLLMDQQTMYGHMGSGKDTYMLSTLCFAYFVHLEGKTGVRALQNYMKDLVKGTENKKAIKKLYGRRNTSAMQEQFLKAWEDQGVKIQLK